ncbi:MAG: DUF4190 domain-containing protein [Phycisphaeraceae bacterium]
MSQPPPPPSVRSSSYACSRCGYDLSGSVVGGACPECGAPVSESLRLAPQQQGGTSTNALISMILGIVGIAACGLVGPFAIWLYYRAKEDVRRGVAAPSSMGMAKAGLILGWVSTVLTVLVVVFYAVMFATMF